MGDVAPAARAFPVLCKGKLKPDGVISYFFAQSVCPGTRTTKGLRSYFVSFVSFA